MCNAYRSKSTQKCTPHLRHSTGLAGMGFLLFSLALERFAVVSFFTIAVEASTDNKNKNTTACGTESDTVAGKIQFHQNRVSHIAVRKNAVMNAP